ncbi:MAG: hypothetical protein CL930_12150 [Deltaproteobacteria bacterium]|nr:hypothetical protein [Deltaproteobacteria bacterium]
MTELRHERERRGWSLDDVATRTRIPRQYLEALEEGNHEILPPGPFFRGYLRQYLEFLGQSEDPRSETEQDAVDEKIEAKVAQATHAAIQSSQLVPLTRLVLAGFVLTLAIVLALQVSHRLTAPQIDSKTGLAVPLGPPHKVRVYAIENVKVKAVTDGNIVFDSTLAGSTTKEFNAVRKLEIEVSDLTRVLMHYNDERLEPLGNLSRGRRLVFLHEAVE